VISRGILSYCLALVALMHVILALGIYYQVEAATYLDRDWDQFKADNPFGSGNKANKRC